MELVVDTDHQTMVARGRSLPPRADRAPGLFNNIAESTLVHHVGRTGSGGWLLAPKSAFMRPHLQSLAWASGWCSGAFADTPRSWMEMLACGRSTQAALKDAASSEWDSDTDIEHLEHILNNLLDELREHSEQLFGDVLDELFDSSEADGGLEPDAFGADVETLVYALEAHLIELISHLDDSCCPRTCLEDVLEISGKSNINIRHRITLHRMGVGRTAVLVACTGVLGMALCSLLGRR